MWQIQQLEQFRAVYEHGNLSAAARALGVTQSAVSRGLQKLEKTLDITLFQRHTRRMHPTDFAHALYKQIREVLQQTAGLDRLVERFHAGREGTVRLGCGPFVPDLLSNHLSERIRDDNLHIHLDLQSDHIEALSEGLYSYRYDFLIYDQRHERVFPDDGDIVDQTLFRVPLKIIAPSSWLHGADDPVLHEEAAARAMVAKHAWAMPRVAPHYVNKTAEWFREMLMARRGVEFVMPTIGTCLALCRAGHALTVAPEVLVASDVARGTLVVLPLNMGGSVQTNIYRLRSRPLSDASKRVWEMLAG